MVLGVLEVLSVEQTAFPDVMRWRCARWGKADYATIKATVGCAFGSPHIACPRAFRSGIARLSAPKSEGVTASVALFHHAANHEKRSKSAEIGGLI